MKFHKAPLSAGVLLITVAGAAACDDFFDVPNVNVLEAEQIDPVADGETLARSAYQNLAQAYGELIVRAAWWSHEARVGDTFPTRNDVGRRFLDEANGEIGGIWSDVARALATSEEVVKTLGETPGLPLAIAAFSSGYSLILMAETFCEGTIPESRSVPGPQRTTAQLLDAAVERLQLARTTAGEISGAQAAAIHGAALVGIARAHLQAGRNSEAASIARQVPANLNYEVIYFDDPNNRGRLGNAVWNFSISRLSLVVPPDYIAMADVGDPRIRYVDTNRVAQDGELRFIRQDKYIAWATPIRLASGLEARYIAAEASGDAQERLALIAQRRAAGNQPSFQSTDPAAILAELMAQRSRDFWLEGKRMGDFRRHPGAVPNMLTPGSQYYKQGVGTIGDQSCWPVPAAEKLNNPNW